ncbi:class I SAM-dependent DNA methyltransferase [Akkermansia muciniphila]|nr:DNA methyltransferase [Akkermansia muciniphila]
MFQACVAPDKRSCLGEHYTSVPNIMKVLRPLFLEELENAARQARGHEAQARKFIDRLRNIRFFDPACGSGNFLIVAYKEVRRLEMEVLESVPALLPMPYVSINQFYGIEIDDFAHEIAMLSLWLAEHQMNQEFFERLGKRVPTLPLRPNEHIVQGNALRLDWETVCPKTASAQEAREPEIYIFGNPPYLGSKMQSAAQKEEVRNIYGNSNSENISNLDYVCGWIGLGTEFIAGSPHQCAFVTTNSITQGEQVGPVWDLIFKKNIEISFAYTSFKWTNNAKYQAGVTCVIIGLRRKHANRKSFIYNENKVKEVDKISPYLIPGSPVIVRRTKKPVTKKFPPMVFGSMPRDGGYLILTEQEYHEVVNKERESISFIKRFSGSQEFIRGKIRYCFWIAPEQISQARKIFEIRKRLELVSNERNESKAPSTRAYADRPYLFVQRAYKPTDSIIIPRVSSERREYIPMGYLDKDTVIADSAFAIYDAEPWVFGILTSRMHMAWVRVTCGRLKTDYRYSATLCYNTFPLRELTEREKARVTEAALGVLDAREAHPEKTPAELYDPDRMPENLRQAHDRLDAEVDRLYRVKGFKDDGERLECLFELYREMTQEQQTE